MSGLIGNIPEFSCGFDDWNVYSERLDQYFEVNDIPNEKRSALLISVVGNEAYKTLRDLCHPALPKDKEFEELCQLLHKQYSPQVSIFRERIKFYKAQQETYENVSQWYARVKTMSIDCKFGENLETILMDRFVSGLRNPLVLDRICEEDENLILAKAVELAVNKESAVADTPWNNQPYQNQGQLFGGGCGGFGAQAMMAAPQALGAPQQKTRNNRNRNGRGRGGSKAGSVCGEVV